MFRFTPISEDDIRKNQNHHLLTPGTYPFTVKEIRQAVSQAGNPMIEVRHWIKDKEGNSFGVFDCLLATPKMIFKLKHFLESIGMGELYKAGQFDIYKCLEKKGRAQIIVKKGDAKKDGSGYYADKNAVKDYINLSDPTDNLIPALAAFDNDFVL